MKCWDIAKKVENSFGAFFCVSSTKSMKLFMEFWNVFWSAFGSLSLSSYFKFYRVPRRRSVFCICRDFSAFFYLCRVQVSSFREISSRKIQKFRFFGLRNRFRCFIPDSRWFPVPRFLFIEQNSDKQWSRPRVWINEIVWFMISTLLGYFVCDERRKLMLIDCQTYSKLRYM